MKRNVYIIFQLVCLFESLDNLAMQETFGFRFNHMLVSSDHSSISHNIKGLVIDAIIVENIS